MGLAHYVRNLIGACKLMCVRNKHCGTHNGREREREKVLRHWTALALVSRTAFAHVTMPTAKSKRISLL